MKTILLVLVFLVASPFTSGSCPGMPSMTPAAACKAACGTPSMTPAAACKAACGTPLMFNLCMDTLREFVTSIDQDTTNTPSNSKPNEVTAYALLAARRALESYKATVGRIFELLRKGGLTPKEVLAYMVCLPDYAFAEGSMGHISGDMLPRCSFPGLLEEYQKGINLGIESCRNNIVQFPATPLNALVLAYRNKAVLTFFLGRLLLVR